MNKNQVEIKKMLIRMGISPDLKGYHHLAEAIAVQRERFDKGVECVPCMELYSIIAKEHNDTASRVERAIRFAIERGFDIYNEELKSLFEPLVLPGSGKVTNACFICTMAEHFAFEKAEEKDET